MSVSSDFLVRHLGRSHPTVRLPWSPIHQFGGVVGLHYYYTKITQDDGKLVW